MSDIYAADFYDDDPQPILASNSLQQLIVRAEVGTQARPLVAASCSSTDGDDALIATHDASCQAPDDLISANHSSSFKNRDSQLVRLLRKWCIPIESTCEENIASSTTSSTKITAELTQMDKNAATRVQLLGARKLTLIAACPLRPFDGVAIFGWQPQRDMPRNVNDADSAAGIGASSLVEFYTSRLLRSRFGRFSGEASVATYSRDGGMLFVGTREGVLHVFDTCVPAVAAAGARCSDTLHIPLIVPSYSDYGDLFVDDHRKFDTSGSHALSDCPESYAAIVMVGLAPITRIGAGLCSKEHETGVSVNPIARDWAPRELLADAGLRTLLCYSGNATAPGSLSNSARSNNAQRVASLTTCGILTIWSVFSCTPGANKEIFVGIYPAQSQSVVHHADGVDSERRGAAGNPRQSWSTPDLCAAVGSRLQLLRVATVDFSSHSPIDATGMMSSLARTAISMCLIPRASAQRGEIYSASSLDIFVGMQCGFVFSQARGDATPSCLAVHPCQSRVDTGMPSSVGGVVCIGTCPYDPTVILIGYENTTLQLFDTKYEVSLHVWWTPWVAATKSMPPLAEAQRLVAAWWLPGKAAAFAAVDSEGCFAVWDMADAGGALQPVLLHQLTAPQSPCGTTSSHHQDNFARTHLSSADISGDSHLLAGTTVVTFSWSNDVMTWLKLIGKLSAPDAAAALEVVATTINSL